MRARKAEWTIKLGAMKSKVAEQKVLHTAMYNQANLSATEKFAEAMANLSKEMVLDFAESLKGRSSSSASDKEQPAETSRGGEKGYRDPKYQ